MFDFVANIVIQDNMITLFSFVTLIEYETGFETEDLNGWNNTGWSTNTGYTSSIDTGPTRAAEG